MGLSPSAPPRESGQPRRCGEAPAGAMPLLWCWLIGCTLFLSVSHSKLITYIWPVFPAVAILAAVAWVRLLQGSLADPARRLAVRTIRFTCLGGAALLPAAMLAVQPQFAVRFTAAVWVLSVLVAMSIWIALWPLSLGRLRAVLSVAVLSLAAQYVAIMAVVLPPVASNTSARDLAGYFNRLGRVPPRVVVVEERIGSLVFYLEPGLRAGLQPGQLLGVPLRECGLLGQLPSGGVVALAERYASSAAGPLELDGAPYARAGRYRVYDASRVGPRSLTASAAAPDGERRR
jgi:hypothetical protein